MDTTEQCNAVISHFNGKFIKIASGTLGRNKLHLFLFVFPQMKTAEALMIDRLLLTCRRFAFAHSSLSALAV